ncbi:MAG: tRNA (N6-isopentenyl adenosine(37)-C2)-methylthiotransferase MiaB [Thermodesulfobacteriota bacterium]|nr:tRNA (N6-isopentenyl adenosine(37)-C2)-methylthiotransferase MiaB [Thermodesulfobacteriota bacterium]
MGKYVFIKTFGCQMNERDSEIMEQLLSQAGYLSVAEQEDADLVILNTCSIRAKAEQKVFSLLGLLRKQKENQPELRIAVAGCVAQQEGKQIFKRMPHVDIVVGTQQIYQLPDMLLRLERNETRREISCDLEKSFTIPPLQKILTDEKEQPPSPAAPEFRKFVTIMQGCNNFCSYCVVPATRGREISRPVADILEEVELLVKKGVKEITLLGQNVNSYGCTNSVADQQTGFADLLQMVAGIPGVERLRFTSSNPQDLSIKLMRCFGELDTLCPHFHLPVQSGSNAVLKRMHRKYTRELYLEKVDALRSFCPEIAISTDMIVGFPGETDQDFEETMDLLETVRFHGSFSFKYSDRPNTRSADFGEKVDEKIKGERLQRFQKRQDQISLQRNRDFIGQTVEVMVESLKSDSVQSRTGSNHIVHFSPVPVHRFTPGDIAMVTIVHAGKHSLNGELAA